MGTECEKIVNIGPQYADHRQKFLDRLAEFEQVSDGRLGQVDMAKNRIQLTSQDLRPTTYARYCAEPKARIPQKKENDKMLCMIKWSLQRHGVPGGLYFQPRKDVLLCFVVGYRKLNAVTIQDAYSSRTSGQVTGPLKQGVHILDI